MSDICATLLFNGAQLREFKEQSRSSTNVMRWELLKHLQLADKEVPPAVIPSMIVPADHLIHSKENAASDSEDESDETAEEEDENEDAGDMEDEAVDITINSEVATATVVTTAPAATPDTTEVDVEEKMR